MGKPSDTERKQYEEQGYFLRENAFSAEDMNDLTSRIDKLDEERENELRTLGQQGISIPKEINFTGHLVEKDERIKQFAMRQIFVDLSTSLLGPDIKLFWDQSVYKRPEAKRDFPWHQDTGYVPMIEPQHYVTCWLALEDVTIENGCVWILPKSHLGGLVEHKETPIGKMCYFGDDPGMPVPLRKGSMVVFQSLLFHRSTPNLSRTTRKGYVLQYSVADAYNQATGEVYNNGPVIAKGGKPVLADG